MGWGGYCGVYSYFGGSDNFVGRAVLASFCRVAVTGNCLRRNVNSEATCFSVCFEGIPSNTNFTVVTKIRRLVQCLGGLGFRGRSVRCLGNGNVFYSRFVGCLRGFGFRYSI